MKVSEMYAKIKAGLKELIGDTKPKLVVTKPKKKRGVSKHCITIKENKGQALIKCWKCGKELWVRKGSPCHDKGLCGNCVY